MSTGTTSPRPLADAPFATAAYGHVILDHPAGLAVTLTAAAALIAGHRLVSAAAEAARQTVDDRDGEAD